MLIKIIIGICVISIIFGQFQILNAFSGSSTVQRIFNLQGGCDHTLNFTLEEFRKIMANGSTKLDIPPLAPLKIDFLPVNIHMEGIGSLNGTMDTFEMDQLDTFQTDKLDCRFVSVKKTVANINLTIPYLNITGNYNLSGMFMEMIPMSGLGPFSVNITNMKIGINSAATLSIRLKPKITDVKTWVDVEKTDVHFYNLFPGYLDLEELFNDMFTEMGPVFLQDLWPDLEPVIDNVLLTALQHII